MTQDCNFTVFMGLRIRKIEEVLANLQLLELEVTTSCYWGNIEIFNDYSQVVYVIHMVLTMSSLEVHVMHTVRLKISLKVMETIPMVADYVDFFDVNWMANS